VSVHPVCRNGTLVVAACVYIYVYTYVYLFKSFYIFMKQIIIKKFYEVISIINKKTIIFRSLQGGALGCLTHEPKFK
jgi:hypothetical protein